MRFRVTLLPKDLFLVRGRPPVHSTTRPAARLASTLLHKNWHSYVGVIHPLSISNLSHLVLGTRYLWCSRYTRNLWSIVRWTLNRHSSDTEPLRQRVFRNKLCQSISRVGAFTTIWKSKVLSVVNRNSGTADATSSQQHTLAFEYSGSRL
jgi:hypothetical protein